MICCRKGKIPGKQKVNGWLLENNKTKKGEENTENSLCCVVGCDSNKNLLTNTVRSWTFFGSVDTAGDRGSVFSFFGDIGPSMTYV